MKEQEIINLFLDTSAYLKGHFQLTSGLHSNGYMQCALVLQNPEYSEKLGKDIALLYKDKEIDCVLGPAMGGVVIAHEVARALGVRSIFTERKDGEMKLRRGFSLTPGEKVLIVEDVITTGGSVKEVIELIQEMGVEVVGVGSIINRSDKEIDFTVDFRSLAKVDLQVFDPTKCPLCEKGAVIDKPGSRS